MMSRRIYMTACVLLMVAACDKGEVTWRMADLAPYKSVILASDAGDVDGDGDLDVVLVGMGIAKIYLNDGGGKFLYNRDVENNKLYATDVKFCDVDGDEDLDLVVANFGYSYIYFNDGDGNYSKGLKIDAKKYTTRSVVMGDVDNDGDSDVVTGNEEGVRIYLNYGTGEFLPIDNISDDVGGVMAIAMGDVDGDRDLDIIASVFNGPVYVYFNDGYGGFNNVTKYEEHKGTRFSLGLGDVNNDGYLDIVSDNGRTDEFEVLLNDGAGIFAKAYHAQHKKNYFAKSIAMGDVNCDGSIDVLTGNENGASRLYVNDGNGGFSPGIDFSNKEESGRSVLLADLDGNNNLDMVVSYLQLGSKIFFNDGSQCALSGKQHMVNSVDFISAPPAKLNKSAIYEEDKKHLRGNIDDAAAFATCSPYNKSDNACVKVLTGDALKHYNEMQKRANREFCDSRDAISKNMKSLASKLANPACYPEFESFYSSLEDYNPSLSISHPQRGYVKLDKCREAISNDVKMEKMMIDSMMNWSKEVNCASDSKRNVSLKESFKKIEGMLAAIRLLESQVLNAGDMLDKATGASYRWDVALNEKERKRIAKDFVSRNTMYAGKHKDKLVHLKEEFMKWKKEYPSVFYDPEVGVK